MGKKSKSKASVAAAAAFRTAPAARRAKVATNPFSTRPNQPGKQDILGRRVKGGKRDVTRAKAAGIEARSTTLAAEAVSEARKQNTFTDGRLGEGDAALDGEDRMLLRVQAERRKKLGRGRNAAAFRLGEDGEEDALTHGGAALTDARSTDTPADDNANFDDALDARMVRELHFGGGAGGGAGQIVPRADDGQPKTRREIMDEVIARSKMHKAEKAAGKEAQEDMFEQMDDGYSELLGLLDFRKKDDGKASVAKDVAKSTHAKATVEEDAEYDRVAQQLASERRAAAATDRTKTPAEMAKEEAGRLGKLEQARVARMHGIRNDADDSDDDDAKTPGQRRAKRRRQEELERMQAESGEGDGDGDGGGGGKLIMGMGYGDSDDESESGDGGSDDDDSDSDDDGSEGGADDGAMRMVEEGSDSDSADAHESDSVRGESLIPYTFECPKSLEELEALFREHAATASDAVLIVERIFSCHRTALNDANRSKMHNLYGALLRLYLKLGDATAHVRPGGRLDPRVTLAGLEKVLPQMTREIPLAAGAAWRRQLSVCHSRLLKKLRDVQLVDGADAKSCWPSTGTLLLLRLVGKLFPTTDFRHGVVTPALLLLGQCLAQCPVRGTHDLAAGLYCAALQLDFTAGARRVAPEALAFVRSVLARARPAGGGGGGGGGGDETAVPLPTVHAAPLGWLRAAAAAGKATAAAADAAAAVEAGDAALPRLALGRPDAAPGPLRDAAAAACVGTALRLARRAVAALRDNGAFAELYGPLRAVLAQVAPAAAPALPPALAAEHARAAAEGDAALLACRAASKPLRHKRKKAAPLESLDPAIEEHYVPTKKRYPDQHMLEPDQVTKKLKQEVKRESKAAARELRKDAQFLNAMTAAKSKKKSDSAREERQANHAWLQNEQATFNQQVRMHTAKGGGSQAKRHPRKFLGKK